MDGGAWGLQSMGGKSVGHNLVTKQQQYFDSIKIENYK